MICGRTCIFSYPIRICDTLCGSLPSRASLRPPQQHHWDSPRRLQVHVHLATTPCWQGERHRHLVQHHARHLFHCCSHKRMNDVTSERYISRMCLSSCCGYVPGFHYRLDVRIRSKTRLRHRLHWKRGQWTSAARIHERQSVHLQCDPIPRWSTTAQSGSRVRWYPDVHVQRLETPSRSRGRVRVHDTILLNLHRPPCFHHHFWGAYTCLNIEWKCTHKVHVYFKCSLF